MQHPFNGLTFNLDDWIYGADGESSSGIRPGQQLPTPQPCRCEAAIFAFARTTAASSRSPPVRQVAMTFDDWGNPYINSDDQQSHSPSHPAAALSAEGIPTWRFPRSSTSSPQAADHSGLSYQQNGRTRQRLFRSRAFHLGLR